MSAKASLRRDDSTGLQDEGASEGERGSGGEASRREHVG